jgi:hypothetical protein
MANRKNYSFDMLIASGYNADHSFNHKFGAAPKMKADKTGTVWDIDDTPYPWDALDPATNIHVVHDSDDAGLELVVQGLDSEYRALEETITLTGTDTAGLENFHRINRAFLLNGTNAEHIDIRAGADDGTIVARITKGMAQTLMAVFTVPRHCTAYLHRVTTTVEKGGDCTGLIYFRYNGTGDSTTSPLRIAHTYEVQGDGGQYFYDFAFPLAIPEQSDIDMQVAMRTKNTRVTCTMDLLLVENDHST